MIKAKKKFGQNFLKDYNIVKEIIQAMPKNDHQIIEIGPGLGDLTQEIVKYKEVKAYEVDRDLISILKVKFSNEIANNKLELVQSDVLETWRKEKNLYNKRYDLIANLPYYIATRIILEALQDSMCQHIVVMVQKEVADKFIANFKEREYSSLGVIAELLCKERKEIIIVPPTSFEPQPNVNSSVIYLEKNMTSTLPQGFKSFLKVAFSQPRKKLCKNLSQIYAKDKIGIIFENLNLSQNIRPHELKASLYSQIYQSL